MLWSQNVHSGFLPGQVTVTATGSPFGEPGQGSPVFFGASSVLLPNYVSTNCGTEQLKVVGTEQFTFNIWDRL